MLPIASTSKVPFASLQNQLAKRCATTVATVAPGSTQQKKLPYRGRLSKPGRVYTKSKRELFNRYTTLLTASPLVLFFRPTHLTPSQYNAFRAEIKALSPNPEEPILKITHLRTNLLPPLLKTLSLPSDLLLPELTGDLAVLTTTTKDLDPPILKSFVQVLDKHVNKLKNVTKERQKYLPKPAVPFPPPPAQLTILSSILEGRKELSKAETLEFVKLPGLDSLRSQIVGLVEHQARQVVGVLGRASGESLVGLLEGRVKQLEPEVKEGEQAAVITE